MDNSILLKEMDDIIEKLVSLNEKKKRHINDLKELNKMTKKVIDNYKTMKFNIDNQYYKL